MGPVQNGNRKFIEKGAPAQIFYAPRGATRW